MAHRKNDLVGVDADTVARKAVLGMKNVECFVVKGKEEPWLWLDIGKGKRAQSLFFNSREGADEL